MGVGVSHEAQPHVTLNLLASSFRSHNAWYMTHFGCWYMIHFRRGLHISQSHLEVWTL
jgi:hypothetical protein